MSDLFDHVKKFLAENLGIDESRVKEDANLMDDLGVTSWQAVELIMDFEEKFGVEIPDEIAEKIVTVKDAIKFIERLQKRKREGARQTAT